MREGSAYKKKGGDLLITALRLPLNRDYAPAAVFLVFCGKISLNAVMNRAISSAVPIDTRMCFVIGGNGRPTATFFVANSWMTGWISRPMATMKKFVSDGRHS